MNSFSRRELFRRSGHVGVGGAALVVGLGAHQKNASMEERAFRYADAYLVDENKWISGAFRGEGERTSLGSLIITYYRFNGQPNFGWGPDMDEVMGFWISCNFEDRLFDFATLKKFIKKRIRHYENGGKKEIWLRELY